MCNFNAYVSLCYKTGVQRRPTLPRSFPRSTIGAEGLNNRGRNGNGWIPFATITELTTVHRPPHQAETGTYRQTTHDGPASQDTHRIHGVKSRSVD